MAVVACERLPGVRYRGRALARAPWPAAGPRFVKRRGGDA